MNCIMATKFLLSRAFFEIMMPFSVRTPILLAPVGPISTGIFMTVAPGIFAVSFLDSFCSVWALQLMTRDLPLANFCRAWSSVCVKLSGSSSFSLTSVLRYWSICLYCGVAPVYANFLAAESQVECW